VGSGRIESSGNCTIRVLPEPDGPLGPSAQAIHEQFARFRLGGEAFGRELPLVALNVPADADLPAIRQLLESGQAQGWWEFEEGCVTDAWRHARTAQDG
jgi:hypothetical protein